MNRDEILAVIYQALRELNEEWKLEALREPSEETRLYGAKSGLDSIALVTLIVRLEELVGDRSGRNLILADDRAMSQLRSPFRRVGALADHIAALLAESQP